MSAMDSIYADPTMFISYRIGVLKTRLSTLDTYSRPTEVQIAEIKDQLSTLSHLYDLLTKKEVTNG